MKTVTRILIHFAEMWLAMLAGMMAFMAVPVVMQLPKPLHLAGMAISMSVPMVLWMKVRGHGWRHGLEMSGAMLMPWAAVLMLVAVGAGSVQPWLEHAGSPAMLLGMLGYMLLHHGHYARTSARPRSWLRLRPRKLLKPAVYGSAVLLLPLSVGLANLLPRVPAATPPPAPGFDGAFAEPTALDPGKRTAVVLSSAHGSEITDTLPPYEILTRSGVFNVYSVAPERKPLPLSGGDGKGTALDFVPQLSFADYESKIGGTPDLIVIPYFPGYSADRDGAIVDWIREHFGPNTTILSICAAGLTLADTGLLENRTATTNTGIFDLVQRKAPTANLVHNVRYLDDGNIVTSEDLTTGIDATLHIVDRFAGRAAALEVAGQVGYTPTDALDDPTYTVPSPRFGAVLANAAFTFPQENLGVLLYDGVSEFGLAGIIDPYGGSLTTRLLTMAPERTIVVGRSGFAFLPRHDFSVKPDRVLLPPGSNSPARARVELAWTAAHPTLPAGGEYVGNVARSAYDVSLADLARTRGAGLARAVANTLLYPTDELGLSAGRWPLRGLIAPLVLSALAATVVFLAGRAAAAGQRTQLAPLAS